MTTQASKQSRMFRSIVLMGSGLALGCAGKAEIGGSQGSVGSAGGSVAGAGAAAGAGAGAGVGGANGGAPVQIPIDVGGAPSTAGTAGVPAGTAGAPDCPPAQWTCSNPQDCSYDTGWTSGACKCDPSRPSKSADCKTGQEFVCLSGGSTAADQPRGFQCSCVSPGSYCSETCASVFSNSAYTYHCDNSEPGTVLCGCAVVLLK